MTTFANAVYLEEGNDIFASDLSLYSFHNHIINHNEIYDYALNMNSTRPFRDDTAIYGVHHHNEHEGVEAILECDLTTMKSDEFRACVRAKADAELNKYTLAAQQNY